VQVREIMSENPACCGPDASVQDAARLMVEHDCGEIPVVDSQRKPIGVVTDRDIACRGVAEGKDGKTPVREVMSSPAVTVSPDTSLEDCCRTMEENQIRRVPVVDEKGGCCGMVAQADVALEGTGQMVADVVRDVSRASQEASRASSRCC
jgi:CBS domain-containing protein